MTKKNLCIFNLNQDQRNIQCHDKKPEEELGECLQKVIFLLIYKIWG
jgi:hypothetical protein